MDVLPIALLGQIDRVGPLACSQCDRQRLWDISKSMKGNGIVDTYSEVGEVWALYGDDIGTQSCQERSSGGQSNDAA